MGFFRQAFFLFKLLLMLKSYRFLYCVLTIVCIVSNYFLYPMVSKIILSRSQTTYENGLSTYSAEDFVKTSRVVANAKLAQTQRLLEIVANRLSGSAKSFLADCDSKTECTSKYFNDLHSSTDTQILSYVDYEAASSLNQAVVTFRSTEKHFELGSVYFLQLVAQSLESKSSVVFKDVKFFTIISEGNKSDSVADSAMDDEQGVLRMAQKMFPNSTVQDSICTRNYGIDYQRVFPMVLVLQMALISTGLTFYILLGNVSCITRLKQNGFLKLMHQNGLSVGAYWSAMWSLTIVEMLIFGCVALLSLSLQCPIYSAKALTTTFLMIFLFGIYLSAIGYMLTSLIKSFFITLLLMILVTVAHTSFIIAIYAGIELMAYRYALILFPFFHIGELLIRVLPHRAGITDYYLAILILSIVMTVLLILVSIYIDFLTPNGNGYDLPATFIFQPGFWNNGSVSNAAMLNIQKQPNQANIESVSSSLKPRIKVLGVGKIYHKKEYPCSSVQIVEALKKVTCTVYGGQITALIGHNGAGKTTLQKILIGEENPTDGKAAIDDRLVTDPLQRLSLRGHLGICHQTDTLCRNLTVMQSIELTLTSRGLTLAERKSEVADLLSMLGLDDKVGKSATDLSGGQKRKLCTILALIGDPKVIFLDEPTSGLDPVSRRRLWQILQKYKVGRAIVLCTQFMDEADILADRKIFLSSGSLICAGSSLFLKHAFGCGFVLNVSIKSEQTATRLLESLRAASPSIKLQNQFRTEVELILPASESDALPSVVRILETKADLVEAFGLSQATLDDIFMRLKDVNLKEIEASFESGQLSSFAEHQPSASKEVHSELQTMLRPQGNRIMTASAPGQFAALMKLNLIRLKRAKLKLCCRLIFPTILLLALVGALFLERKIQMKSSDRSNFTAGSGRNHRSFCIKDVEDPSGIANADCARLFNPDRYPESPDSVKDSFGRLDIETQDIPLSVISKNRSMEITTFLNLQSTLNQFNNTERQGSSYLIVYSSLWSRSEKNSNRKIYIGFVSKEKISKNENLKNKLLACYFAFSNFFGATSSKDSVLSFLMETFQSRIYFVIGLFVCLILFSIVPVTHISDPLDDRASKVRFHLRSMGISDIGYWFNTFLLHWCQYALFVILSAVLLAAIVPSRYGNAYFLAGVFLPCLFIGCASNQLSVYAIGMVLEKPNPITVIVYFFFVLWLSLGLLAIQLHHLTTMFLIWLVPPFATIAFVYFSLKLSIFALSFYELSSVDEIPNKLSMFFSNPYVLHSLLAVIIHIILLIVFIVMMENRSEIAFACRRILSKSNIQQQMVNRSSDAGVKQEIERVSRANRSRENVLEVKNLEKKYGNGVLAVKGVSFGALSGEIFGLLGPNGAGKTTTLSIVVGEEVATSGSSEVCFGGVWMTGSNGATSGAVGYCPQHNPLFNSITVMEHMEFYSRIRGVPEDIAKNQIPNLVSGLGLGEHKEKQAKQLSGGNKRRLCLAISLLGNPSLVVIDEASTGVDPEAKRLIWKAIRVIVHDKRSVVVTTHSMEEVEALCSRVGIMSHGQMIAFGTIQQLRSRYGHAYTLDILLSASSQDDPAQVRSKMRHVISTVLEKFPQGKIAEELFNRVQFVVPQESIAMKLSDVFAWLNANKAAMSIQYYTFYQMSLDQVFVHLVKEHEDIKT